jgi:hypothetical protein
VAWQVQLLVRDARLPRTVKRRPEVKAVLRALADKCQPDGTGARPAVATIAAEAEIGVRTAHACLAALRDLDLIVEQEPPRQHKPRVWRLNLHAIRALDPKAGAQHAAGLTSRDPQTFSTAPQETGPGAQFSNPDAHAAADDPVLRIPPLIPVMIPAPSPLDSHVKKPATTPESDEDKEQRMNLLKAARLRIFGTPTMDAG